MGLQCSKDHGALSSPSSSLASPSARRRTTTTTTTARSSGSSSSYGGKNKRLKKKKGKETTLLDPFVHDLLLQSTALYDQQHEGKRDDDDDDDDNNNYDDRTSAKSRREQQHDRDKVDLHGGHGQAHLLYHASPKSSSSSSAVASNSSAAAAAASPSPSAIAAAPAATASQPPWDPLPVRLLVRRRTVRSEEGMSGTHIYAIRYPPQASLQRSCTSGGKEDDDDDVRKSKSSQEQHPGAKNYPQHYHNRRGGGGASSGTSITSTAAITSSLPSVGVDRWLRHNESVPTLLPNSKQPSAAATFTTTDTGSRTKTSTMTTNTTTITTSTTSITTTTGTTIMVGSSSCRDDEIDGVTFVTGPRPNKQTSPEDPNHRDGGADASATTGATSGSTTQDPASSGAGSGLIASHGHDDTEAGGTATTPSFKTSTATNRSSDFGAAVTPTAPSQPTPKNAATSSNNTDVGNLFDATVMSSPPAKQLRDWVTVSEEHCIYLADLGLSKRECHELIALSEQSCKGQYAAYTYAKQTLGCREYPALAQACQPAVHLVTHVILQKVAEIASTSSSMLQVQARPQQSQRSDRDDTLVLKSICDSCAPGTSPCVQSHNFPQIPHTHNLVLDDREPHMVKYDVSKKERQKLDMHTDKSEWTFLIALSNGSGLDYEGGGTYFECLDATVLIPRGMALIFPGRLRHCGQRITAGLRFLLVGFLVEKGSGAAQASLSSPTSPSVPPTSSSKIAPTSNIGHAGKGSLDSDFLP